MALYRTDAPDDAPREVALDALSPETQRTLAASCEGEGALLLAADRPPLVGSPGGWALSGAAAAAVAALLIGLPFGDIAVGPRSLRGAPSLYLALCLGWASFSALLALRAARLRPGLVSPGVYLFASDLIDTRGAKIQIFPTSCLEQIGLDGRHIRLRFAGGAVHELPRTEHTPPDLGAELASLRNTLAEAEAKGDGDTRRRLDPLRAERERWHELPTCASLRPRGVPRAMPLAVGAFSLAALLTAPLASLIEQQSDLRGVRHAIARGDHEQLSNYLAYQCSDRRAYALADAAIYQRARASSDSALLLGYLYVRGAFARQAVDELLARIRDASDDSLAYQFARADEGKPHEEVDQRLLDAARAAGTEEALARYAAAGRRADEIRRSDLPMARLGRAFVERRYTTIRAIASDATIDAAPRREATLLLENTAAEAHQRLLAVSGLKTVLARALDQATTRAILGGKPLLYRVDYRHPYSPYQDDPRGDFQDQLTRALHRTLRTYADESLLGLHQTLAGGDEGKLAPVLSVVFFTHDLFPKNTPARVEIELTYEAPGEPPQRQSFTYLAPHPRRPINGRSFEGVSSEQLTRALLGE